MSRNRSSRRRDEPARTSVPRDPGSERVKVIAVDPAQPEVARAAFRQLLADLEGTLFAFGGKAQITVEREVIGHVQLGDRVEPVAETVAFMLRFQSASPLRRPEAPERNGAPEMYVQTEPPPERPPAPEQGFTSFGDGRSDDDGPPVDPVSGEPLIDVGGMSPEQLAELGLTAEEIDELELAR